MKKIFLFLALSVVVFSCKNSEEKNTENEEMTPEEINDMNTYSGDFIYTDGAAVLKGNNFIYGVVIDKMSEKLANLVKPIKTEELDMVPVKVMGSVRKNPVVVNGGEGWDEIITITKIVNIGDKPAVADIKIEEKKD